MTILVTGATGYIGRNLVRNLCAGPEPVRTLVRPGSDAAAMEAMGAEVSIGDLVDPASVDRAIRGCRQVFHLGAVIHGANATPSNLRRVNVEGSEQVGRSSLKAGVERLIYASSVSVYGRRLSNQAITERTPPRPDSPYSASKLKAERRLLALSASDGLPLVIARLSTVFGSGARDWAGLFRAIASGRFRMLGTGSGHYHPADVLDVVDGLLHCASITGIEGNTYLLAGQASLPFRQLVALIAESVGAPPPGPCTSGVLLRLYKHADWLSYRCSGHRLPKADRIDLFLNDRGYDIGKARAQLGFEPRRSARQMLQATAAWLRAEGLLDAES
ncbi:NAD-dependent epimerase/dehydratase family protein [Synechococcus sp. Cruz-9H2]|uniref:NAD-dependent epimerase/dehydratase family protein n=1 Tax=unclassified Synechococcus TaxID=2626047 RepID=UPI0020CF01A4|nr:MULTISPECIES: NAD-dependent epimerase/dehydratase family protein [unclassified Synechococcus]MCP9818836.1 NAD-dependent epimerase/dehydratase family protein [Synechococcus sp. Cruz-9H2]MCP9843339.1 NAD-dependent epimerase/dehydratase family protein [Synechococcus sp. Edmonson 11F2]MCP9855278.1 NAD-dependent epimerase/dehydratase family protein [Synechococcus sp. Cruz-9C9]MCP9862749.1 NAD-dependent epimerase/dehydratase family protein [Synechococcus sp. Cruz-7E5]MCP9869746.1 NAD-dependent ep